MQRSTALSSQQGELRHAATGLNALVRVTFIRSLNGIGDSLNGLASAWLLSQFFGVEFSVCWPEANVSWAVPSLSAECITPKREWERRVISQVHGAKNTWDKRNYRDQAWQQMLVWGSGAYVGVGKVSLDFYKLYSKANWSALRRRPHLFVSSHRGFIAESLRMYGFRNRSINEINFGRWLHDSFHPRVAGPASGAELALPGKGRGKTMLPWRVFRHALRNVLRVPPREPSSCCVHFRQRLLGAVKLQDVISCASLPRHQSGAQGELMGGALDEGPSCSYVRVYSDLHTKHLATDLHLDAWAKRGRYAANAIASLVWLLSKGILPLGHNWSIGSTEDMAGWQVKADAAD